MSAASDPSAKCSTEIDGEDLDALVWRTAVAVMTFDFDCGDYLELRHVGGQSGTISAQDLLEGQVRVVDRRTREISEYESVERLVIDGWALGGGRARE